MSVRRVAVFSMHTSPLAQPGSGDGGGMNVYVRALASALAGVLLVAGSTAWRAVQGYRAMAASSVDPSVRNSVRQILIAEGMYVLLIALLLMVPPLVTRAAVLRRAASPTG